MENNIAIIRQEYLLKSLHENDTNENPITQFNNWFHEAIDAAIDDVNAMTLATTDEQNKPHARIVLLKGVEENKFIFFTNYNSHKGNEIKQNRNVALVFYWKELQRQVRIEGTIAKISEEASTQYFHSRPRESQIGAWASHQSEKLFDRKILENRMVDFTKKYEDIEIPKPTNWGGYALTPNLIEFWQGRANRLHDRIIYSISKNNFWEKYRLNP